MNRMLTRKNKEVIYRIQNGYCSHCLGRYCYVDMQGQHIIPTSEGGTNARDNFVLLCRDCYRKSQEKRDL
jgi:5-methylcytosine-specific restriction endonuclease McrA